VRCWADGVPARPVAQPQRSEAAEGGVPAPQEIRALLVGAGRCAVEAIGRALLHVVDVPARQALRT
jgi:hypothetical protein